VLVVYCIVPGRACPYLPQQQQQWFQTSLSGSAQSTLSFSGSAQSASSLSGSGFCPKHLKSCGSVLSINSLQALPEATQVVRSRLTHNYENPIVSAWLVVSTPRIRVGTRAGRVSKKDLEVGAVAVEELLFGCLKGCFRHFRQSFSRSF
jgi:hypothetical protein